MNRWIRDWIPPALLRLLRRLRHGRKAIVEWEALPEGWAYAESHAEVKGWNRPEIVDVYREKWSQFVELVSGTGPLGIAHESTVVQNKDLASHNAMMAFAYVLAQAAHGKESLSLLDWGGGIGHYCLIAQATLPQVDIDYHCKDVPLLADYGTGLLPEQSFYSDESCLDRGYDLVMASASMHYTEEWRQLLRRFVGACQGYVYITSLPIVREAASFVFVQRAYAYGYNTEYIGWCLNRDEFLAEAQLAGLDLVREFVVGHSPVIVGAPEQNEYWGFLFRGSACEQPEQGQGEQHG